MNFQFLFVGLAAISAFTTLTTEAIKKVLHEAGMSYSSNLLAAFVAIVLTLFGSIGYIVIEEIESSPAIFIEILALMFLSFLCATLGFDKIKQTLIQLDSFNK